MIAGKTNPNESEINRIPLSSSISPSFPADSLAQSARQRVKACSTGLPIITQNTTSSPCMVFSIGYRVISKVLEIRSQFLLGAKFGPIYY
jgi:hypothetical protein